MTIQDIFHETSGALLANKARSGLTVLGIIIGIASVIAMLAVGQGASGSIQSSIQSLGSNLVIVTPGATKSFGSTVSSGLGASQALTVADANAIAAQVSSVAAVAPEYTSRKQVVAGSMNTNTTIDGTVPAYTTVRSLTMSEGTFFTDTQETGLAKVAILGPTTETNLFGTDDAVGKTIKISNVDFTVIGIAASKGGTGFSNNDDRIYIPLSTAQIFLAGANNTSVSDINIEASDSSAMAQVQSDVTTLLLSRHKISNPANADFTVINQTDILSAASSVTTTFTVLLASVAGISLIVGGIGIMNMMLTTVTERTKEIGLRKAVGAKKNDISTQFLVEAVMLTFLGGFIGIILGWIVAFIITLTGLLHASVSVFAIVLAFGVSALIGIVFGYYPARRAASLNPIEALRYE